MANEVWKNPIAAMMQKWIQHTSVQRKSLNG